MMITPIICGVPNEAGYKKCDCRQHAVDWWIAHNTPHLLMRPITKASGIVMAHFGFRCNERNRTQEQVDSLFAHK